MWWGAEGWVIGGRAEVSPGPRLDHWCCVQCQLLADGGLTPRLTLSWFPYCFQFSRDDVSPTACTQAMFLPPPAASLVHPQNSDIWSTSLKLASILCDAFWQFYKLGKKHRAALNLPFCVWPQLGLKGPSEFHVLHYFFKVTRAYFQHFLMTNERDTFTCAHLSSGLI